MLVGSLAAEAAVKATVSTVAKVACKNNVLTDTLALTAAIATSEATSGTVDVAAGTCALDARLVVDAPVTIEGAGPTATSLIQHRWAAVFRITAKHVTIEDLNLDTATYNTTPPQLKNPDPYALLSRAGYTTVRNVDVVAGSGFGIRFVGPNPCSADLRTGDVISGVNAATSGNGGFAAVDVDCQNGVTLDHIVIHGGILSLYQDRNVTLHDERFAAGANDPLCKPPWFITGPALNISIDWVTSSAGAGDISSTPGSVPVRANSSDALPYQTSQDIVASHQTVNASCPVP